jgi:uncharacterized protein with PIN domain
MNFEKDQTDVRFLADATLGRLAKWLRVMGFNTHYQPVYKDGSMDQWINTGYLLLTRQKRLIHKYPYSLLIRSDHIEEQLKNIKDAGYLLHDRSKWFLRCLRCNTLLEELHNREVLDKVPEFVLNQTNIKIHFCPSCNRFFWKGSHVNRMTEQLKKWGYEYGIPLPLSE